MSRAFKRGALSVFVIATIGGVVAAVLATRQLGHGHGHGTPQVEPDNMGTPEDPSAPEAKRPPRRPPPAPAPQPEAGAGRAAPGPAEPSAEETLMKRLRTLADSEPAAIALAREGNRRFPGSADAPERTAHLIHALAAQGQASAARGEAEDMVNHYPDSPWVREIERFTGAHRHRNARVNDAGQIELYDP